MARIYIPPDSKPKVFWFGDTKHQDFVTQLKNALVEYSKQDQNRTNYPEFYTALKAKLDAVGAKPGDNPEYTNVQQTKALIDKALQIKGQNGGQPFKPEDFGKPSVGAPTGGPPATPTVGQFVTANLKMTPNPLKFNPDTKKKEACYILEFSDRLAALPGKGPSTGFLAHLTIFLNHHQQNQPAKKNSLAFQGLHITVEMQGGGAQGVAESDYPRCWVMTGNLTGSVDRITTGAQAQLKNWATEKRKLINALQN
jgi:hypothetical protein